MNIDLLNSFIESLYDKQALPVIELLLKKRDLNEFIIAKKLKLTIHQTRNILYKLSANNLVSSIRKKDKKKGWYIYYWTLNYKIVLDFIKKRLEKEAEQLKHQIRNREIRRFYICKTCNVEVNEETALINNFTCRECGQVFELNEDKKFLRELNSKLEKAKREISALNQEIVLIEEKSKKMPVPKKAKKIKKPKKKMKKAKKKKPKKKTKKHSKKVRKHQKKARKPVKHKKQLKKSKKRKK
jgi:transcription factor E